MNHRHTVLAAIVIAAWITGCAPTTDEIPTGEQAALQQALELDNGGFTTDDEGEHGEDGSTDDHRPRRELVEQDRDQDAALERSRGIATNTATLHVKIDRRSDVYQLGLTLYRCLTGRYAYGEDAVRAFMDVRSAV